MFLHLLKGLRQLVYPGICQVCKTLLPESDDFCTSCRDALTGDAAFTCPRCARSVGQFANLADGCQDCRDENFRFEQALRLGLYAETMRDVVLQIKHLHAQNLAHAVGRLWATHHEERFRALKPDVVVPIPLHWWRRWCRGYNQSEMLAEAVAESLGLPCRSNWLYRTRSTVHQTNLSAGARMENVKGAFACRPVAGIKGLRVLLVDDVMTTGNTANEAAKAMLKSGAAAVCLAVLARR